jgi:UDP-N-acetylmuramoyl-L-alanyl-D-glutamate--2,6-diaminopimelate ligase
MPAMTKEAPVRLADLAVEGIELRGEGAVPVTALTADSREVVPGAVFAALRGARADGLDHVEEAIARGAVAVLADRRLERLELPVARLIADDPRRALARAAAALFARQPETAVAVTGTNGKTSTASFTRQLWRAVGLRAASLGTLGVDAPGFPAGASLTTPDPVALHRLLAELARAGIHHLVMEASSHGLDQRRLDGVELTAAAFLNLTRDHLDYHGSEAAYLAAKRRLFDELLAEGATAVLNADMSNAAELRDAARSRGLHIVEIGRSARDFRLETVTPRAAGQALAVVLDGARHELELPVVGGFQAYNLLAALALAEAGGADRADLLAAVGTLAGPRGRMELVARHGCGAAVFVDYAHTPDALEQALAGLRPHAASRLHVVFGCGGDRDGGKRPEMGAIATRLADRVIVTDDNPRSEDAAAIRRAILAAAPGAVEIGGRAAAIEAALDALRPGDVLLVAGKGHETGQIVGDTVHPFDDADVVRRALGVTEERR